MEFLRSEYRKQGEKKCENIGLMRVRSDTNMLLGSVPRRRYLTITDDIFLKITVDYF